MGSEKRKKNGLRNKRSGNGGGGEERKRERE